MSHGLILTWLLCQPHNTTRSTPTPSPGTVSAFAGHTGGIALDKMRARSKINFRKASTL